MFRQPVFEERARNANCHRLRILGNKCSRLEPGVEAMPVHLGFNPRQNLIPQVHLLAKNRFRQGFAFGNPPIWGSRPLRATERLVLMRSWNLRPSKIHANPPQKPNGCLNSSDFPQFFPQVWKSLGTGQMRMQPAGSET